MGLNELTWVKGAGRDQRTWDPVLKSSRREEPASGAEMSSQWGGRGRQERLFVTLRGGWGLSGVYGGPVSVGREHSSPQPHGTGAGSVLLR